MIPEIPRIPVDILLSDDNSVSASTITVDVVTTSTSAISAREPITTRWIWVRIPMFAQYGATNSSGHEFAGPLPNALPSAGTSTKNPGFEAYRIVNEISGGRATNFRMISTKPPLDRFGPRVVVEVDADAREALEIWVRAAREARGKGFILEVRGTREMNVNADELIEYAVRALVEMEIPLFIDPNFDSVEAVREARRRIRGEARGDALAVPGHLRPHLTDTPHRSQSSAR
jgi:hypothetical protein